MPLSQREHRRIYRIVNSALELSDLQVWHRRILGESFYDSPEPQRAEAMADPVRTNNLTPKHVSSASLKLRDTLSFSGSSHDSVIAWTDARDLALFRLERCTPYQ